MAKQVGFIQWISGRLLQPITFYFSFGYLQVFYAVVIKCFK